jgi:ribosomal-protein-alanine acetyltransferase
VIAIRGFLTKDLSRIVAIERQCFGEDAWPRALFENYASSRSRLFLVAVVENTIAGYAVASVERGRTELDSIAVARRYRGRGIARRLLADIRRKVIGAGVTTMALMVRTDNTQAIRLYRQLGFIRTRTVPAYYEDGAAAWRMRAVITKPFPRRK